MWIENARFFKRKLLDFLVFVTLLKRRINLWRHCNSTAYIRVCRLLNTCGNEAINSQLLARRAELGEKLEIAISSGCQGISASLTLRKAGKSKRRNGHPGLGALPATVGTDGLILPVLSVPPTPVVLSAVPGALVP